MKYNPSNVPLELLYDLTPDEGIPLTLEINLEASERVFQEWMERLELEEEMNEPSAYKEIKFQM